MTFLLSECWLSLPKVVLPGRAGMGVAQGEEGWRWVALRARASGLLFLLAGGLPELYFPPRDGGDLQPLSLGGRVEVQEQGQCLWCGPVQAAAVPIRERGQHSDLSRQAVAGGSFEEGVRLLPRLSHLILGPRGGSGAGVGEALVVWGRPNGCVHTRLVSLLLVGPRNLVCPRACFLSLADLGSVIA